MIKNLFSTRYIKYFSVWLFACFIYLLFSNQAMSQTLAQGDVSIIGFSANAPKGIAFVVWKDILAGTKVFFSENGYNSTNPSTGNTVRWRKPYGYWENTSGNTIAAGTVITLQNETASIGSFDLYAPNSTTTPTNSTFFTFGNSSGGHIFAYSNFTLPSSNTANDSQSLTGTLLFGLAYQSTNGGATWLVNGPATSSSSCKPSDLTNNIYISGNGNAAQYKGAREGKTPAEFRELIADVTNWDIKTSSSTIVFTTTSFPVNTAPTVTTVTNTGNLQIGKTLTGNYTYTDAESNPESGSSFKWYRADNALGLNKAAIASATGKTYLLSIADMGKYISFEVTPRDGTINGTAVESALRGPVVDPVLPVGFVGLSVKVLHGSIKLDWQTTSEKENDRFDVYRSSENKAFEKIGEVQGKGTTSGDSRYSFIDKAPLNGENYYKLVQLDLDGKPTELGIKSANFKLKGSILNLYPNPTKDKVDLGFEPRKYTSLSLSTIEGRVLETITIKPEDTGAELDLRAYPNGVYLIKLIGTKESISKKLIKQ